MTEEEAKTKWCPFVRAQQFQPVHNVLVASGSPLADNPAVNRDSWNVNCIGSACMAWRASGSEIKKFFVTLEDRPEEIWYWDPSDHKGYKGRVKVRPHSIESAPGYCGLAGKP